MTCDHLIINSTIAKKLVELSGIPFHNTQQHIIPLLSYMLNGSSLIRSQWLFQNLLLYYNDRLKEVCQKAKRG